MTMFKSQIDYVLLQDYPETRAYLTGKLRELIRGESVVLDAGCGKFNQLLSHCDVRELVGVDINSRAVAVNRSISRGIVADLHSLDLAEASFDGVMSFDVLEHLEKPELFLQQVLKVVKPGGFVFLVTPNKRSLFGLVAGLTSLRLKRILFSFLNLKMENEVHYYRANTTGSLRSLLSTFGCSEINLFVLNKLPSSRRFRALMWPYFQLCRLGLLRRFGVGLLCIARKA